MSRVELTELKTIRRRMKNRKYSIDHRIRKRQQEVNAKKYRGQEDESKFPDGTLRGMSTQGLTMFSLRFA